MIRNIFYFFALCLAALCGTLLSIFNNSLLNHETVDKATIIRPTILLDNEGKEWARFSREQQDPVPFKRLPKHLIDAVITIEDRSFFSHHGISIRDIIRSIIVNVRAGRIKQGASTITQQLIKLHYFDQRRLFSRKIAEQWYALLLERELCKEEIFERYINSVYFGCGIYGVSAAARAFWNRSVEELSCAQSALLAGIICSPSRLCPLTHFDRAKERQIIVLKAMLSNGIITNEEYMSAQNQSVLCTPAPPCIAPHFREYIRKKLEKIVGKERLYTDGFTVQTTLNKNFQQHAYTAFEKSLADLRKRIDQKLDGALISLEYQTGAIRAYIGGYNYAQSQFDRVRAARQIGSLIKPFIYAVGFENGLSPDDYVIDEPLTIGSGEKAWSPKNFNNTFVGPLRRDDALAKSNNICAIKTYQELEHSAYIPILTAVNLNPPARGFPAFALGCIDRSLEKITAALAIFPQHGLYTPPYAIEWIRDWSGKKIFSHTPAIPIRAIRSQTAQTISSILTRVPQTRYRIYNLPSHDPDSWGKTGTTNDARSIWYCGGAGSITTGIYLGRDDHKALQKIVLASQSAFPTWYEAMRHASSSDPADSKKHSN